MRADEFKFKVTDKKTGVSAILSLNDLYGYEGEVCGVLIRFNEPFVNSSDNQFQNHIPKELECKAVNYNSGYGFKGICDDLEFDYVEV